MLWVNWQAALQSYKIKLDGDCLWSNSGATDEIGLGLEKLYKLYLGRHIICV